MMRRLSRRAFACGVAALAVCSRFPALAHAQQPKSPRRIGVLLVGWSPQDKPVQEFQRGLREAGYTEGRDVVIEWRSAEGRNERVPALVTDLVQRQVHVIVVAGTVAALEAKRATSAIPIVMALVADPVGSGLAASLAHPGGNVTGLSNMIIDISAKRLQLLKEMVPRVTRVAVLWNPTTPFHKTVIDEIKVAARSLSVTLKFIGVQRAEEIGPAFSAIRRARAQALYVIEDALFLTHRAKILKLASEAKLPDIHGPRQWVDDGGLMSYGVSHGDSFRRSAYYVDRILKGTKPADLPIEQPTRFELVVNLRTAKAFGLTIPESIFISADEMIK